MYFGNDDGILEYDGSSWRLIKTSNNSIVRSMCMDSKGRIYVAASSDFGYLDADSIGQLQFVSLRKLSLNIPNFGDVWDVNENSNGIYFKPKIKFFVFTIIILQLLIQFFHTDYIKLETIYLLEITELVYKK
ncbi:MAG: hypothetical protein IPK06_00035 [Ignavibacteriae bacterium]|nr:hypothetical protein [Ignavibacteriota bacterium]